MMHNFLREKNIEDTFQKQSTQMWTLSVWLFNSHPMSDMNGKWALDCFENQGHKLKYHLCGVSIGGTIMKIKGMLHTCGFGTV